LQHFTALINQTLLHSHLLITRYPAGSLTFTPDQSPVSKSSMTVHIHLTQCIPPSLPLTCHIQICIHTPTFLNSQSYCTT